MRGPISLLSTSVALGVALALPGAAHAGSTSTSPELVETPLGKINASCFRHIGPGEQLKRGATNDTILHADGSSESVKHCSHSEANFQPSRATAVSNAPTPGAAPDGWQESTWMSGPTKTNYFYSTYHVPTTPTTNHGQTVFYFTSAEDSPVTNIIQPVLQYGTSAAGGTSGKWSIASWSVGDNTYSSEVKYVNSGDEIYGSAFSNDCTTQGGCKWTVWTADRTTGVNTTLNTYGDKRQYVLLQPGVLESYGISTCTDFPNSAVTFTNVHFKAGANEIKEPYSTQLPHPVCGESVTSNADAYTTTMHVNGH